MRRKYINWNIIKHNFGEQYKWLIILVAACELISLMYGGIIKRKEINPPPQSNVDNITQVTSVPSDDVYELSEQEFNDWKNETVSAMYATKDYMNQSVLMHINPYEVHCSSVSWKIIINENEFENCGLVYSIINKAYKELILSQECLEFVISNTSFDKAPKYLKELFLFNDDFENSIFSFTVRGMNENDTKEITDAVKMFVKDKSSKISSEIYVHSIHVYDEQQTVAVDRQLDATQRSVRSQCIYYLGSGNVEAVQNSMRLITNFGKETIPEEATEVLVEDEEYSFLIGAVFAFVIGGVLFAFYLFVVCLRDNRVYDYRAYADELEVSLLEKNNDDVFWFDLSSLLANYTNKKVGLFVDNIAPLPRQWFDIAEKYEIEYIVINGDFKDIEKMEQSRKMESMFIVAQRFYSSYNSLDYLVERLNKQNKKLCGIIVQG